MATSVLTTSNGNELLKTPVNAPIGGCRKAIMSRSVSSKVRTPKHFKATAPASSTSLRPSPPPSGVTSSSSSSSTSMSPSVLVAHRQQQQQQKRDADQLRHEVRQLRAGADADLRRQRAELDGEYRRRLEHHRLGWQANREKAVTATAVQLKRHYESQLKAKEIAKEKEISSLKAKLTAATNAASERRCAVGNSVRASPSATRTPQSAVSCHRRERANDAQKTAESNHASTTKRDRPTKQCSNRPATGDAAMDDSKATKSTETSGEHCVGTNRTAANDRSDATDTTTHEREKTPTAASRHRSRLPVLQSGGSSSSVYADLTGSRSVWDLSHKEDAAAAATAAGLAAAVMFTSLNVGASGGAGGGGGGTLPRGSCSKRGSSASATAGHNTDVNGQSPSTPTTPLRAFGGLQTVSKEDHERERNRMMQKVDDTAALLQRSESFNFDLTQVKVELKKRILELEKNQKPLIDTNRRLEDRNRNLMGELKKFDERLRHSQDDYLTLRDAFERVNAENGRFKERRFTPEKHDELDGYKQQNLEYSKCITALRQAAVEKDRRIDLLLMKLRRMRGKCHLRGHSVDRQSEDESIEAGSECSISSISLDTIAEDLEELQTSKEVRTSYQQLLREHQDLQRECAALKLTSGKPSTMTSPPPTCTTAATADCFSSSTTSSDAQRRIAELERELALVKDGSHWLKERQSWIEKIQGSQRRLEQTERDQERLLNEVAELREQNELLEFQVLEMEENSKQLQQPETVAPEMKAASCSTCDRSVSTSDDEAFYSSTNSEPSAGEESLLELSSHDIKTRLTLLKHRQSLKNGDRQVVVQAKAWIDDLLIEQEKLQTIVDEKTEQHQALRLEHNTQIENLQKELQQETSRKNELEQEIDFLHSRITEIESVNHQLTTGKDASTHELDRLRYQLKTVEDRERRSCAELDTMRKRLSETGDARKAEIEMMERSARSNSELVCTLRDELEQHRRSAVEQTETTSRLREELSALKAQPPVVVDVDDGEGTNALRQKYTEAKTKLKDAHRLVKEYEGVLTQAKQTEDTLRRQLAAANADGVSSSQSADAEQEQQQLRAYNAQLEQQFGAQMKMMQTMKRQIVELRAGRLDEAAATRKEIDFLASAIAFHGERVDADACRQKAELVCQQHLPSGTMLSLRTGVLELLKNLESCLTSRRPQGVVANGGGVLERRPDSSPTNGASAADVDDSDDDQSSGVDDAVTDSGLQSSLAPSVGGGTRQQPPQQRRRKKKENPRATEIDNEVP